MDESKRENKFCCQCGSSTFEMFKRECKKPKKKNQIKNKYKQGNWNFHASPHIIVLFDYDNVYGLVYTACTI